MFDRFQQASFPSCTYFFSPPGIHQDSSGVISPEYPALGIPQLFIVPNCSSCYPTKPSSRVGKPGSLNVP